MTEYREENVWTFDSCVTFEGFYTSQDIDTFN